MLRKSPLKTYAAGHVTSHSHLHVDYSAEKESNKKTYAAVHLTSHSHLQVVCSAEKESFKILCCSTCDITFSLAIVCSVEKESFKKLMLQYM